MDFKDYILLGGGILIILVLGHGFWIAWRAKGEALRLDIMPKQSRGNLDDLDDVDDVDDLDDLHKKNHPDDIERLRGELPNGGARVIDEYGEQPAQVSMELDGPTATEASALAALGDQPHMRHNPKVHQASPRQQPQMDPLPADLAPAEEEGADQGMGEFNTGASSQATDRAGVGEVRPGRGFNEPVAPRVSSATAEPIVAEPQILPNKARPNNARPQKNSPTVDTTPTETAAEAGLVEELLVVNLVALKGHRFAGEDLVNAMRGQRLRYGDMNIFHRIDPVTKARLYSVANILEPGTFDLSDLAALSSPGMTFFLQLPGPDNALAAFEDMLTTARNIRVALGGDVRDEQMSVLTRQTEAHMRQRIADYARRRLSKRA